MSVLDEFTWKKKAAALLILTNLRALDNELLQAQYRLLQVIFLFYFKFSFLDRCRKAVENAIYAHYLFICDHSLGLVVFRIYVT